MSISSQKKGLGNFLSQYCQFVYTFSSVLYSNITGGAFPGGPHDSDTYRVISAIFQHYRRCVPRRSPRLRYLQRRNSRYTAKKSPNPPRALSLRHPRRCGACRVFHNLHTTALSVCFSLSLSYRIQTLGPNLENSFSSLVMLL